MVFIKKKTNMSALEERRARARELYSDGFTMREVGDIMKKSRQWVHNAVKKPSPLDKVLTKD